MDNGPNNGYPIKDNYEYETYSGGIFPKNMAKPPPKISLLYISGTYLRGGGTGGAHPSKWPLRENFGLKNSDAVGVA